MKPNRLITRMPTASAAARSSICPRRRPVRRRVRISTRGSRTTWSSGCVTTASMRARTVPEQRAQIQERLQPLWRHPKAGSPKRPQRRTRRHGRRRRRTRRRSTANGAPRQHQMPTPTGSRQPQASGTRSGPNPRHAPHAAAERGHKGNAQPPRPTGDERRQKGAGRRDEACRLGLRITEHERRGRRARIGWSPSLR